MSSVVIDNKTVSSSDIGEITGNNNDKSKTTILALLFQSLDGWVPLIYFFPDTTDGLEGAKNKMKELIQKQIPRFNYLSTDPFHVSNNKHAEFICIRRISDCGDMFGSGNAGPNENIVCSCRDPTIQDWIRYSK